MGLQKGDLEKVPKGLSANEYYQRIYDWHKSAVKQKSDEPYGMCYRELVEALPQPKGATMEDIAFICYEVIAGLMEWAYHQEDNYGVKTAAYAHYILDNFFDGFHGQITHKSVESSKMFPKYSLMACLERKRQKIT